MGKQTPMPDWLRTLPGMSPEMRRQFRKFLKQIHKLQKKKEASSSNETKGA